LGCAVCVEALCLRGERHVLQGEVGKDGEELPDHGVIINISRRSGIDGL